MIKTSSNFDTYNDATGSKPVWIIKFSFSANYYSSGSFADEGSYTVKKIAGSLRHIGMTADLLNFHTDFGGYDFELMDIDDEVRGLLSNDIINDSVTVYIGYQELNLADFIQLPIAVIKSYGLKDDLVTYWFKARINLLPTKPIFQNMGRTFLVANVVAETSGEHLNETDFATHAKWDVTDGFNDGGGDAAYTHNAAGGTLTQTESNRLISGEPETVYKLRYDVTALVGSPTCEITTEFADTATDIPITSVANDKVLIFKSAKTLGNFTINVSASDVGESFTLDNLRLEATADYLIVDSTLVLQSPGLPPWDTAGTRKSYINVGGEIMEYTSKTNPNITVDRNDTNGTRNKKHFENEEVFECIYAHNVADGSGEPEALDFLASVLTTTSGGANGDYDKSIANFGLGINEAIFDWTDIKNQFQKYASQDAVPWIRHIHFINPKTGINDGLKWIEETILKNYPAYFFMTFNGLISIRFFDIYNNKDGLITLTDDDIVNISTEIRKQDVVTHINQKVGIGETSTIEEIKNDTSDNKWGEIKRIICKYDLYDTGGAVPAYQSRFFDRLLSKFGNPPIKIKFSTISNYQKLQIGDVIDITYDKMPVFTDGSLGWTREAFEIIKKEIVYTDDEIIPTFEGINTFLNEKVDVADVVVYEQTDMNDDDLTRNADHDEATLQGADAYIDISDSNVDAVMVELTLTEPDVVGGTEENLEIYVKIQNPIDTDIEEIQKFFFYDESGSVDRKAEFMVSGLNKTISRVRVDFTAFTGTPNKEPTLKLSKVKTIKYKYSATTTDL